MMESFFLNQPYRVTYDPHLDADYLQYHETAKAEMDALKRAEETPKARRVRMPSPETDWEMVHKAAEGTPSKSIIAFVCVIKHGNGANDSTRRP